MKGPPLKSHLAFVLVTYNHREDVGKCLEAIFEQTLSPGQVVVVDNDSTDGTAEFVESRYPDVTLIRTGRNRGYGAANNSGVARTTEALVAIVNPDVRLDPAWSEEIVRSMGEHPACGAAEGKLLLARQPGVLNSRGSRLSILGFGCATGLGRPDHPDTRVKEVSYASGAACVVRREAFQEVGGFDETYFLYHEDVDLGLRLRAEGWSVLYVPGARAQHDFRSGLNPEKVRHLEHNRWKTLAKNMPLSYFLRSTPLLLAAELGLVAYLASAGLLRPKILATLDFLKELLKLARQRLTDRRRSVDLAEVMTDDFPSLLPRDAWASSVARRLQSRYYRAFFAKNA